MPFACSMMGLGFHAPNPLVVRPRMDRRSFMYVYCPKCKCLNTQSMQCRQRSDRTLALPLTVPAMLVH